MSSLKTEDADFIQKSEATLDEHRDMINKIDAIITMSPEFVKEQKAYVAMSQSSGLKMSEKVFNDAMVISTVEGLKQTSEETISDFTSYGLTTDAIKDGKLDPSSVYLKDKNDGIVGFLNLGDMGLTVKDGGKKIIIEKQNEAAKTTVLNSDVKNAATTIETWIVAQKGAKTPIVLEGKEIRSGDKEALQNNNFYLKTSDGVHLEVTGDSSAYVITGTIDGSDEKLVYDSAKGGLQGDTFLKGSYDSKAFANFKRDAEGFKSLNEYVKHLTDTAVGTTGKFEVVEKGGKEYVKATYPETKISEKEILFASPIK